MKVGRLKSARLFLILVAIGAMAVFVLAGPAVAAAQASEIRGTVSGPGGTPLLAGVTVCLSRAGVAPVCEESDAEGSYAFGGLGSGTYGISYEPGEGQNYLPVKFGGIPLGSNAGVVLEEWLDRGGELEGHLTDGATGLPLEPTGDPATTTRVCALESWSEEEVKCVPVGPGGDYALAGLPTGSYVLVFGADVKEGGVVTSADGYVRQYYRDKPNFWEAFVKIVEAPNVLTGIDATLVPGEEIWPGEEEKAAPWELIREENIIPPAIDGGETTFTPNQFVGAPAPPPPYPFAVARPHRTVIPKYTCKKGFHRLVKSGTSRCVKVKKKPKKHRPKKHQAKKTRPST
jgi:hypothetical protein